MFELIGKKSIYGKRSTTFKLNGINKYSQGNTKISTQRNKKRRKAT